jgi:hypothetical protein
VVIGTGSRRPASLPAAGTTMVSAQRGQSNACPLALAGKLMVSLHSGHLKSKKLSSAGGASRF